MPRHLPKLAVSDKEAAHMLSLPPSVFKDLVNVGALPGPTADFAGHKRWSVATLIAIVDGTQTREDEFEP